MPYSFEKCCFDSKNLCVVKYCNRTSCILNGSHNFKLFYHGNNDEIFYCLNRKDLGEYWHCVQNDKIIDKLCFQTSAINVLFVKGLLRFLMNYKMHTFLNQTKESISVLCGKFLLKVEINSVNLELK